MAGYKYIGKRIYYLKVDGRVILDTGEAEGWVNPTTSEDDWIIYSELSKYNKSEVDFMELQFGEFKTEFAECTSYHVDVAKKEIVFEYREKPNPPEIPQTPSLHERVEKLESNEKFQEDMIVDNAYRVALLELSAQGISL
ncbi:hypothetical protein [Peptacetobacter hiranonis]|uniref:Uncharacterized protein n=1 Tax=Peptacetobacter hiranonis (strain DSM 13275 / JCM 10541 / KCTC 15199 / TO-931) TaxID=500633 RepID=B6FWZ0_PEPHT|nr:hypothetical protein [Peptacetobacter hiranonis]EEA86051.1 hypothetical protein CLOHIR_00389 [Peptacetobacter hiranonis DSM 13275]QEK21062.1 hypothetical protein KGNDJEFE_01549 [Peptacetobacter hiranonis]